MKIETGVNTIWTFTRAELKILHLFASSEPQRTNLHGVILETTAEHGVAAVATDGHRMIVATQKVAVPDDRVLIEYDVLERLVGLMKRDEMVEIEPKANSVHGRILHTPISLSWGRASSDLPWRDVLKAVKVTDKPAARFGLNPELLEGLSLMNDLGGGRFATLVVPELDTDPLPLRVDVEETTWRVLLMPARMDWDEKAKEAADG